MTPDTKATDFGDTVFWACHADDERSQKVHAFWYRFGGGVVWFTFKRVEDVPEVCDCGNRFVNVIEKPRLAADPAPGATNGTETDSGRGK